MRLISTTGSPSERSAAAERAAVVVSNHEEQRHVRPRRLLPRLEVAAVAVIQLLPQLLQQLLGVR
jgi:hypothetical protein